MRCVCVWGGVSESSPRSARRVLGCSEGVSLRASRSPPSRFTAAGASPLSEGGGGGGGSRGSPDRDPSVDGPALSEGRPQGRAGRRGGCTHADVRQRGGGGAPASGAAGDHRLQPRSSRTRRAPCPPRSRVGARPPSSPTPP